MSQSPLPSSTRIGRTVRLRPGCTDAYDALHAAPWPEVADALRSAGLSAFSIFRDHDTLFSVMTYTGHDLAADLARAAAMPRMAEWTERTRAMQALDGPQDDWRPMREVFHLD